MRPFHLDTNLLRMNTAHQIAAAIADAVREVMKARGETQRSVAEGAGIPLTTLHRKISGQTAFTVVELAAVAEYLATSITDLSLRAERIASGRAAA